MQDILELLDADVAELISVKQREGIFNIFDEDGSNCLTKAEMRPMVKKMMNQGYKFKTR